MCQVALGTSTAFAGVAMACKEVCKYGYSSITSYNKKDANYNLVVTMIVG